MVHGQTKSLCHYSELQANYRQPAACEGSAPAFFLKLNYFTGNLQSFQRPERRLLTAISKLSCASVLKRVKVLLAVSFSCKSKSFHKNGFALRLALKQSHKEIFYYSARASKIFR